eukprot:TRINITY_DN91560_c0_g1_i1.p1 TRINITY_DN91560_c0_g1~~TRINITY_DN91560_c0_g1_i1.p1  ORF type:complete len:1006 (-),score=112.69 TRINITY_DN91560_c0_g1_i1:71-3088(-)
MVPFLSQWSHPIQKANYLEEARSYLGHDLDETDKVKTRDGAQISLVTLNDLPGASFDEAFPIQVKQGSPLSTFPVLKVLIGGQFVYYFSPGLLLANLFLEVKNMLGSQASSADATATYSKMMALQCVLGFVAPLMAQYWTDKREGNRNAFWHFPPVPFPKKGRRQGVREVYSAASCVGALAALCLGFGPRSPILFGTAWAVLCSQPAAVRSVRSKVAADLLRQDEQNHIGQLSTFAGLAGGVTGPIISAATNYVLGSHATFAFTVCATIATIAQFLCFMGMRTFLPKKDGEEHQPMKSWIMQCARALSESCSSQPKDASRQEPLLAGESKREIAAERALDMKVPARATSAEYEGTVAHDPENITNWEWQYSTRNYDFGWVRCDKGRTLHIEQYATNFEKYASNSETGRKVEFPWPDPKQATAASTDQSTKGDQYEITLINDSQGWQINRTKKDRGEEHYRRSLQRIAVPATWSVRTTQGNMFFDTDSLVEVMSAQSEARNVRLVRRGWAYEFTFGTPDDPVVKPSSLPVFRRRNSLADAEGQIIVLSQHFVEHPTKTQARVQTSPGPVDQGNFLTNYSGWVKKLPEEGLTSSFCKVGWWDETEQVYMKGYVRRESVKELAMSGKSWRVVPPDGFCFMRVRPEGTTRGVGKAKGGNIITHVRINQVVTSIEVVGDFAKIKIPATDQEECKVGYVKVAYLSCDVDDENRPQPIDGHEDLSLRKTEQVQESCSDCFSLLSSKEEAFGLGLCDHHFDNFQSSGLAFTSFKFRCLLAFCTAGALLEFGNFAAVVMTFQPLMVNYFGWRAQDMSMAITCSCVLSLTVSGGLSLKLVKFKVNQQLLLAASMSLLSIVLIAMPPLFPYRTVIAFIVGAKSQILFSAPFTAAYSAVLQKTNLGKERSSQADFTLLSIAMNLGGLAGTLLSPSVVAAAGTKRNLMFALPACIVIVAICKTWTRLNGEADGDATEKPAPPELRPPPNNFSVPHIMSRKKWERTDTQDSGLEDFKPR